MACGIDLADPGGRAIGAGRDKPPTEHALPVVDGEGIGRQLDGGVRGRLEHRGLAVIARRELPDGEHERQAEACDGDEAGHEQHHDERHASLGAPAARGHRRHRHAEPDAAIPHPARRVVRGGAAAREQRAGRAAELLGEHLDLQVDVDAPDAEPIRIESIGRIIVRAPRAHRPNRRARAAQRRRRRGGRGASVLTSVPLS